MLEQIITITSKTAETIVNTINSIASKVMPSSPMWIVLGIILLTAYILARKIVTFTMAIIVYAILITLIVASNLGV